MKKLFVLLLALSCVGFVFAEDAAPALKLSGKLYGSVEVYKENSDADPMIVFARSADKGYEGKWRTRVNGAYTDGNYGMNFRLQASDTAAPTFTRTFAWAKFLDGMVQIDAGYLYNGVWMTQGDAAYGELDSVGGFDVVLKPVEGLALGFYVPVTTTAVLLEDAFKAINIGAAYSVEGIGDFQAGYLGSAADDQSDVFFGFNLTAVENLAAQLEVKLNNLGGDDEIVNADEDAGITAVSYQFCETVEYSMEPLAVGFIGYQTMYTVEDAYFGMSFEPYVNYTIGAATLGFDFLYEIDNDAGDTAVIVDALDAEAINLWEATPSVKFALGANTLKLGAHIGDPDTETDDDNYIAAFAYFEWAF